MSQRCSESTKNGKPCKAWAVRGSIPPRCAAHGGGKALTGAPANNRNAVTHGVYALSTDPPTDLNARIADLDRRVRELSEFIDNLPADTPTTERSALFDLQGRLTSRLGRLMKDRQAISSTDADDMEAELREALRIASGLLGVDLLSKKSTLPI